MKKFEIRTILIPTDFSETGTLALTHGAFMARLFKADLILCHVMADYHFHFDIPEPVMQAPDLGEIEKAVTSKLEEMAADVREKYGVRAQTITTTGKVAAEIVTLANEKKADLIIMGTHGAKGWEEYFIGSNAHKVVTKSDCPVLTVQTHATKLGFGNIVLPVDNSRHSRQKVDHAIRLAEKYGSKIHLLGLLDSEDKTDISKFEIKLGSVQEVLEKHKIQYVKKIVKGENLAKETLNYANSVNADLILIMTEHESNMTGMFLGPIAKQIVNHSRIPVLSIRTMEGKFEGVDMAGSSNPMA